MPFLKGIPTLQHMVTKRYSRPDNLFCTGNIANLITKCEVDPSECPTATDHFPILTNILILSCAIFICSCYQYSDLCSTSTYFITSVFCFLLILWSSEPFAFLSSIFYLPFIPQFLIAYFCLLSFCPMFLCSVSIIIFPPSVHCSLPSLSNLDNLTFHPLWLCESCFTFSILHCSPYYSEPCSINFLLILVLAPQLVIVIYLCKNTTHLCLLCLSKLRTPLFLGEGTTHKLKPSPLVSLCYPHTPYSILHTSLLSIIPSHVLAFFWERHQYLWSVHKWTITNTTRAHIQPPIIQL